MILRVVMFLATISASLSIAVADEGWIVGFCERVGAKQIICSVQTLAKFAGPTGEGGFISVGLNDSNTTIHFVDTGNYVPRVDKGSHEERSVPGMISFVFDDGTVVRDRCRINRSADYDNNFSTATGHGVYCDPETVQRDITPAFKKHRQADITINLKDGVWNTRVSLDGFSRAMRAAEQKVQSLDDDME